MRILLTGSSGTIGTRLFERLLGEHEVVGADIRPNKWNRELNARTIRCDLRQAKELDELPKDIDLIIHFAANARVYELVKNPKLAWDNMLINFNVIDYARTSVIKRIIFASSRETYGNIGGEAVTEDRVRLENCESPYSASKLMGEALLHSYRKVYGIDYVIVRFSNVYGMYDDSDRVIPLWLRQFQANDDITVFGRKKILDFTYIDDTVGGVLRVIERFDGVKGNVFNIACGKGVSLLEVAEKVKSLTGSRSKIIVKDNRPGEVWEFWADVSRAKKLLGYEPKVEIEEGLSKTIEWYLTNKDTLVT